LPSNLGKVFRSAWRRAIVPHRPLYERPKFLAEVEGWYSPEQLTALAQLIEARGRHIHRAVEIGCWAGRSTAVMSRALPRRAQLVCVDHWLGQQSEGLDHATVRQAREIDMYLVFERNMQRWACTNWRVLRLPSREAARAFNGTFQLLHLDGGHHYDDVRGDLEAWLPNADHPSLVCGDDWLTAHAGREDLRGGVQRAVRDVLGEPETIGNLWFMRLQ
jgi:hypothetical protein